MRLAENQLGRALRWDAACAQVWERNSKKQIFVLSCVFGVAVPKLESVKGASSLSFSSWWDANLLRDLPDEFSGVCAGILLDSGWCFFCKIGMPFFPSKLFDLDPSESQTGHAG